MNENDKPVKRGPGRPRKYLNGFETETGIIRVPKILLTPLQGCVKWPKEKVQKLVEVIKHDIQ